MTGDLRTIFARIRVRGLEDAYHDFVDNLFAILDVTIMDGIRLSI